MHRTEPFHYDIPHQEWRPYQYETIQELEGLGDRVMIIQAPTGSGKTAFAAAMSAEKRVIALSKTKMLQKENYGDTYRFAYLFGKGNYPCPLSGNGTGADLCRYTQEPRLCPKYGACVYYRRKARAMRADKVALNYAYFMTARWPKLHAPGGYLFLDECHLLSDLVVEHASVTIKDSDRRKWDLPMFPRITSKGSSMLFSSNPTEEAAQWLGKVRQVMNAHVSKLEARALRDKRPETQKALKQARKLAFRVESSFKSLCEEPEDWFIRSGPRGRELSKGRRAPGFVCKPLTARHHFPNRFLLGGPTVLMSATVGNFESFTEELGIDEYRSLRVPSQWPPKRRPVYYHEDTPSIGRKTTALDWEKQADIIAELIGAVPDDWAGVIHCTSKSQTKKLTQRLARRGLGSRLWIPPMTGTDNQMAAWEAAKRKQPGRLAVAWSWWVGVDLLDEKIAIAAKTPYPFIGDEYGRARLHYDGRFYLQRTAWRLQQGCGRTRRGRLEDYDTPVERRGLVAVVDSNWKRVQKYLDKDFRECMTPWPGA